MITAHPYKGYLICARCDLQKLSASCPVGALSGLLPHEARRPRLEFEHSSPAGTEVTSAWQINVNDSSFCATQRGLFVSRTRNKPVMTPWVGHLRGFTAI